MAFLGAEADYSHSSQRFEGYKRALDEAGMEVNEDLIFRIPGVASLALDFAAGRELACRCLDTLGRAPRSIFVSNDSRAIAVIRELTRRGHRVPQDVAVVGIDGDSVGAELPVALTTVRQPVEQLAAEAVRLTMGAIEQDGAAEPESVILQPELVIRESCGCI